MHGEELQSAAVAGNSLVLVWLRLAAGAMTVVGMVHQRHVAGYHVAWPCGQTMLLLPDVYTFLMVSRECWMLSGEVGFHSVLPLVWMPCYWLVGRACGSGQVKDYWLHGKGCFVSHRWLWSCCFIQCMEYSAEGELPCGEVVTGHVGVPTRPVMKMKMQVFW